MGSTETGVDTGLETVGVLGEPSGEKSRKSSGRKSSGVGEVGVSRGVRGSFPGVIPRLR